MSDVLIRFRTNTLQNVTYNKVDDSVIRPRPYEMESRSLFWPFLRLEIRFQAIMFHARTFFFLLKKRNKIFRKVRKKKEYKYRKILKARVAHTQTHTHTHALAAAAAAAVAAAEAVTMQQ